MAYKISRSLRLQEEVELVDEKNHKSVMLEVDISPEKMAMDFQKHYNEVVAAQVQIKRLQSEGAKVAGDMLQQYGLAITALIQCVFGEENTQTILEFFENNYIELTLQVLPFIADRVQPCISKYIEQTRRQSATVYQSGKALNRKQRRLLKRNKG